MDKITSPFSIKTAPPIAILGVPFDNVTVAQTMDLIDQMIVSGRPHYLATANVDFLVQASKDTELRRILFDAHLVICDGTPLVWASGLLGNPLPERVAGSDIVPLLLKRSAEKGYRPFFLGGTPGAAEEAVRRLSRELPDLKIAGYYVPPYSKLLDMDHDQIAAAIRGAKPDILLVGFGCPKQEKWITMHYRSLGVPVSVGVGATIDFLAGRVKRAPRWMQRSGSEWIFRLLQEPRRLFKRYAIDLWEFSGAILRQWWRLRSRKTGVVSSPPAPPTIGEAHNQYLTAPARFDTEAVHAMRDSWEEALGSTPSCIVDLAGVDFIDSTGIGFLIRLQKKSNALGKKLVLMRPADVVERALKMMRLREFFTVTRDLESAQRTVQGETIQQLVAVKSGSTIPALAWQGELTAANAAEAWELTKAYIANLTGTAREITVDLAELRFIDSTGLSTMIRVKKFASREGTSVRFIGVQPPVRNVLALAQLEEFLLGSKS